MPVKKVGKHWEVAGDDTEYKTEAAAENAYKAKAALAFGVDPPADDDKKGKKSKKSTKKKSKKDEEELGEEDSADEDAEE